ncbi:MAG: mycofactocin biosynthesis glycosyltransferase MftF [Ilumatobacteraceae bacterium]
MTDHAVGSFRVDGTYRRHDAVVIAGSPLRLFRLSPAGQRIVEAIEQHQPLPARHGRLTDRLVEAGAIHPVHKESTFATNDVTIVVPAFEAEPPLIPHDGEVIVVDDGSTPALSTHRRPTIRLSVNRGPAAARNAGLAEVTTSLVAFVDTDVDLDDDWLDALLPHFNDPRVALVAPRVLSTDAPTIIGEYESVRSPLDLGDQPARIAAGSRVSYVPGAALVVRTDMLRAIGGFDEAFRTGEDVDMVWRLIEAGHRCRYEPSSIVHHRPRSTGAAWLIQRVTYGRSAAPLDRKHPGAVAPLRISGWSAAVWALVLMRRPVTAMGVAAGTTVALHRKLPDIPKAESIRLAGLGHLYAGRQVANAITRVWWPLALVAAMFVRRLRAPLFAAATIPALLDWFGNRGSGNAAQHVALRVVDDMAYGTGVWIGSIEQRSLGALAPKLTNWPGRAPG